ncbi:MAG: class I SAM-dependent methyltransferase [Myxococcota bacterium]
MSQVEEDLASHRKFLNRSYRFTRHVYDLSRKYYLFGRDQVIDELATEKWNTLVEIGPGTGRNLKKILQRRPTAQLGGVEPCDEMLEHAKTRLPKVKMLQGFAETAEYGELLSQPIDRILFSYCLSMVTDVGAALDNAYASLAPGGEVVVVDFADLEGLPRFGSFGLRTWLKWFHVTPLDPQPILDRGGSIKYGPRRYYIVGRITKPIA